MAHVLDALGAVWDQTVDDFCGELVGSRGDDLGGVGGAIAKDEGIARREKLDLTPHFFMREDEVALAEGIPAGAYAPVGVGKVIAHLHIKGEVRVELAGNFEPAEGVGAAEFFQGGTRGAEVAQGVAGPEKPEDKLQGHRVIFGDAETHKLSFQGSLLFGRRGA